MSEVRIRLDGFSGDPRSLFGYELTVTGWVVTLRGPLGEAINRVCDGRAAWKKHVDALGDQRQMIGSQPK